MFCLIDDAKLRRFPAHSNFFLVFRPRLLRHGGDIVTTGRNLDTVVAFDSKKSQNSRGDSAGYTQIPAPATTPYLYIVKSK